MWPPRVFPRRPCIIELALPDRLQLGDHPAELDEIATEAGGPYQDGPAPQAEGCLIRGRQARRNGTDAGHYAAAATTDPTTAAGTATTTAAEAAATATGATATGATATGATATGADTADVDRV